LSADSLTVAAFWFVPRVFVVRPLETWVGLVGSRMRRP
jgi:hypothetical protein